MSNGFFDGLAGFVFPPRCALCGLGSPAAICAACRAEFELAEPGASESRLGGEVDRTVALFRYAGRSGQAVRRLKYARATALAEAMAGLLAAAFERHFEGEIDLVAPVPIHWTRRAYRGFNQSELLCEGLPAGLVRAGALRRVRRTRPQVGLAPSDRAANLAGAFRASAEAEGRSVLLVDDVVTTGATARCCAEALREGGARRVCVLAFAA